MDNVVVSYEVFCMLRPFILVFTASSHVKFDRPLPFLVQCGFGAYWDAHTTYLD